MGDGVRAFGQYCILVVAVIGGIIAVKILTSNLPDGGLFGAAKAVAQMA